jgi:hypothetical protein
LALEAITLENTTALLEESCEEGKALEARLLEEATVVDTRGVAPEERAVELDGSEPIPLLRSPPPMAEPGVPPVVESEQAKRLRARANVFQYLINSS